MIRKEKNNLKQNLQICIIIKLFINHANITIYCSIPAWIGDIKYL